MVQFYKGRYCIRILKSCIKGLTLTNVCNYANIFVKPLHFHEAIECRMRIKKNQHFELCKVINFSHWQRFNLFITFFRQIKVWIPDVDKDGMVRGAWSWEHSPRRNLTCQSEKEETRTWYFYLIII